MTIRNVGSHYGLTKIKSNTKEVKVLKTTGITVHYRKGFSPGFRVIVNKVLKANQSLETVEDKIILKYRDLVKDQVKEIKRRLNL